MKRGILLGAICLFALTACTSYTQSDYGTDTTLSQNNQDAPSCANLPPEEKNLCFERQKKLSISLINSGNCKSEYEYQSNHCLKQKERTEKQLKDAMKKHIKK